MLNRNHHDFQKYECEFKAIKQNMKNEYDAIINIESRMDSDKANKIHKKYALQIKELQEKYSHLFL